MNNENNPVLSVIIPARNEEACLGVCLESIVSEEGIDFEVIVVDDASTDRTAEIARSFAISNVGAALQARPLVAQDITGNRKGTALAVPKESARSGSWDDSPANHPTRLRIETETHCTAKGRTLPDRSGPYSISADCEHVVVISAGRLPANWTGKNNAMAAGVKIAKSKWLLFTDADTVHKPGSLARAVAEAEKHGASLLSYSPEQEVHSLWEKAVLPVIFAELAATYPPKKVNDPSCPIAAANGQYLLISREAYDAVGGHAKIASDLLEDVAMARLVKSSGRTIFFRYGGDAVRTRMYRTWTQMKEGWTKNLAILFPRPRALAFFRGMEFVLIGANLIAALVLWLLHQPDAAFVTGSLAAVVFAFFWIRIRRAHFAFASNLLALGGLAIFSHLLLKSASARRNGAIIWKGREYSSNPADWSSYLASAPIASKTFMNDVEGLPARDRQY